MPDYTFDPVHRSGPWTPEFKEGLVCHVCQGGPVKIDYLGYLYCQTCWFNAEDPQ